MADAEPLEVTVRPWADAIERHADSWCALAEGMNPSLLPWWTAAAVRGHGVEDQVEVLIAAERGETVAIVPFHLARLRTFGLRLRCLEVAGNLVSYHHQLIAARRHGDVLRALVDAPQARAFDVMHLDGLDPDGETARALEALAHERGATLIWYPGDRSPYLRLAGGWEDYLGSRSGSFRYALGRKQRAVERAGARIRWLTGGDEAAELLERMLHVEQRSWKVEAGMAVSEHPIERAYYRHLLPALAEREALLACVMELDEEPIAYSLCYRWRGRIGQLKTSFSEAHRALSPGLVLTAATIERAFESGAEEFDFHGPAMPHKLAWTSTIRAHAGAFLYASTPLARAVGRLKKVAARVRARGAS